MRIVHVAGARPNFMKVAPVMRALEAQENVTQLLAHTGQHYDAKMSDVFFEQLGLPRPDVNLEVGSGSHAMQTAQVMTRFEEFILSQIAALQKPDWVLVYGDVNSTLAVTLVCAKLLIPVAHVEAGLRSGDRAMPEEINRLVTDQICDLLFTPSQDANLNLEREGIAPDKIHLAGNVMIDTLIRLLPQAQSRWPQIKSTLELEESSGAGSFALVTLHRPSNVDEAAGLCALMETLGKIAAHVPVIFPVHPRTRVRLDDLNLNAFSPNLRLTEPLGYLDFLALEANAKLVITDSGGVQEETTFLGVPCLTVRENTERPITVTMGTNILVGRDMGRLHAEALRVLGDERQKGQIPPLWDGRAGERIADVFERTAEQ